MIITKAEQFNKWIKDISNCVALDTETTSLNYLTLNIVGISLANNHYSCYIDLWNNQEKDLLLKLIKAFLEEKAVTLVLHNAPFDLMVLHKFNIRKKFRVFCTQTAAFILNESRSSYKLKTLAIEDLQLNPKQVSYFKDVEDLDKNSEDFRKYAENDAKYTWDLYKLYRPKIYEGGFKRLFYDIEMPFQYVLRDLGINGVKVDLDFAREMKKNIKESLFNLQQELLQITNNPIAVRIQV